VPYPFLGDSTRIYTQWTDAATGLPLTADPGGTYDMTPAGGAHLTAPPGDGLWGPEPPVQVTWQAPPPLVPPVLTSANTETEEQ